MSPLAEIDERMVDLARRLIDKTRRGGASWKRTDWPGRYLYAVRPGSVTIEHAPQARSYTLRVYDRFGNEQESLPADGGPLATGARAQEYATLRELFRAAERSAGCGGELIDELIAEIG